jgi:glycosyltransferase involved in cell wall biosynthesis
MIKDRHHFLSLIVPIYCQEKTIQKDLSSIYSTLEQIRYDFEIIAVIDGTNADKSLQLAQELKLPKLKVLGYSQNHGKGYALRFGMAQAAGDYICFIDSGMDIDPNGISMVLEHMEWYQADIIVASKRHPASIVNYPLHRRFLSNLAYLYSRLFLGLAIHDTQAGLKIFKKSVLVKVLPRLLIKSFAVDLEILAVAHRLGFQKIYEAPIKINYDFSGSHLNNKFFSTVLKCALDALAIYYRLRLLHYYDDSNHRKWVFDPELNMRINTGQ